MFHPQSNWRTRAVLGCLWLIVLGLFCLVLWVGQIDASAAQDGCPSGADEWDFVACDDGETLNGYWWSGGWVPGLIRNRSQFLRLPLVFRGRAVWYAPGLMEGTADYRGLSLDGYVDGVASMSCADVGLPYWISRDERATWEGPFLVVDCPQLDDVYAIIVHRAEAVEVGWKTAERWGRQSGGWPVLVSRVPPEGAFLPAPFLVDAVEFEFTSRPMRRPLYRSPSTWRIEGDEWTTFERPETPIYLGEWRGH